MTTLSQWMRSFLVESRAEILPRCRRDYPLSPPINRGWFYGLREEKTGSKISQKISFLFFFQPTLSLLSLSLSPAASSALEDPTETFLLHQQTTSQPTHEPKSSPAIGTATARSSLSSLQILFFCIVFFLPPPQAANTATIPPLNTSSTTGSQHNHQSTTKLPPRLSLSSPSSLSLSSATFSSSSHSWLRPPSPQPNPPEPLARHPQHVRDPQTRQLSPPCVASFFVAAAACRIHFCMQRQNN